MALDRNTGGTVPRAVPRVCRAALQLSRLVVVPVLVPFPFGAPGPLIARREAPEPAAVVGAEARACLPDQTQGGSPPCTVAFRCRVIASI
ncbi:hypothetical protein GCM10010275_15980 [Streptomyces litmocidini]|nr:hypothetical protein GCM10010275_15980 [Streptomyces litmocidini]